MYDLGKNALPENYQHELDKVLDRIHLSNGRPLSEPYGWLERGKEEGMQFGKDVGFGLSDYIAERVARAKDVGAVIVNLTAGTNYSVTNSQLGRDAERGVGTWDLTKQVTRESVRDLLLTVPASKLSPMILREGAIGTAGNGLRFVTNMKNRELLINGGVGASASVLSQLASNHWQFKHVDMRVVGIDTLTGMAGTGRGLGGQMLINGTGSIVSSAVQDQSLAEAGTDLTGTVVGTGSSRLLGNIISNQLGRRVNYFGKPEWVQSIGNPLLKYNISDLPNYFGTVGGVGGGELLKARTKERVRPYFRNGTDRQKVPKTRR